MNKDCVYSEKELVTSQYGLYIYCDIVVSAVEWRSSILDDLLTCQIPNILTAFSGLYALVYYFTERIYPGMEHIDE